MGWENEESILQEGEDEEDCGRALKDFKQTITKHPWHPDFAQKGAAKSIDIFNHGNLLAVEPGAMCLLIMGVVADARDGRRNGELVRVWSWSCPCRLKEAGCKAKCRKERHAATENSPAIFVAKFSSGCSHKDHSVRVQADEMKARQLGNKALRER